MSGLTKVVASAKSDPAMPASGGPCALSVLAVDALAYSMNQTQGNITPTGPGGVVTPAYASAEARVADIEKGAVRTPT